MTMHSMEFYVSTCRCVMQANPDINETWADLYRLLPCLRQSLSCYVCTKILLNPIGPPDNVCRHFICKKCRGGKMKLKPSCSWCKDQSQFEENFLLRILVTSFIKLCRYIWSSPIGKKICSETINLETNSLISILHEALGFEDEYVVKSSQSVEDQMDQTKETVKAEPVQPVPGCSNSEDEVEKQAEIKFEETKTDKYEIKGQDILINHQITDTDKEVESSKTNKPEKTVVFMKRAAKNRLNKKTILKSPGKKSLLKMTKAKRNNKLRVSKMPKRETLSDICPVVAVSTESDLENERSKKLKLELPPPELKPLSFCRCGKSGKYNQLTCLGQRCPCYSMKLPCIGCKCKGCRNPKKGPPASTQDHFSSAVLRSGVRNHNGSLYVM